MDVIEIQLDSVRKSRKSPQEYRYIPRARWKHLEVVGEDWIVRDLCRLIAADNPDFTGLVHVFRGDTLCFTPMSLKTWVKHNPFALAPSVQYYNPEGEHSSSAPQIVNGETPEQLRKDKT